MAEILIEILLVIVLFRDASFLKTLNKSQLVLSAVLFFLTLLNIFSLNYPQIFFGNEIRLQGIFLLWHLLVFSLLSSRFNLEYFPKILFPVSLIFLLITAFIVEPDISGRAVGTLGEANALASSAVFFWPLAFILNFRKNLLNHSFKLGILLTALLVILLSGSRSGMLAFILQIVFLVAVKLMNLKKVVILVMFLIAISLALPFFKGGGWYENRGEIWKTAIFAGRQKILGHGFGNTEPALYQASLKLDNNLRYQAVDSSHNILLDFWVQGGIVGLGSLIILIYLSLKGLIRQFKVIEITVFLGLIVALLFNPGSVVALVAFWFVLGQGFKRYN